MKEKLQSLVDNFDSNYLDFTKSNSNYNESETRNEFIDPFFELLGWDIYNKKGIAPELKEVRVEREAENDKYPDYTFTLNGEKKFFVEAKKPSVNIDIDKDPAFQTRRYGWSAKHPIAILTNFEYLLIYDTTIKPQSADHVRQGLLKSYHYTEYVEKWEEIKSYLSREVVYNGTFEDKYDTLLDERDKILIDEDFLRQINIWRIELAKKLHKKHDDFSIEKISDLVQEFINQIVFLRICEDRNLPLYHNLKRTLDDSEKIKDELTKLFKFADMKYNSGIFNGDNIIFDLDNRVIMDIIETLYYPNSPYMFNIIEANLLGQIYEMFLSEKLVLSDDQIHLKKKEENKHRDIVTTPDRIVQFMVKDTLDPIIKDKSPKEILEMKIADISCGSGIFLIKTFEYIVNYFKNWYLENGYKQHVFEGRQGEYRLSLEDKRKILTSCIYGVDIDYHAVEVARFNLLLKLLEDETRPTLINENSILPKLDKNIKMGNSLIDSEHVSYYDTYQKELNTKETIKMKPFDWKFKNRNTKFDVIIGNPPYVATEHLKNILTKPEYIIFKKRYESSHRQFDKYFLFIERGIDKLKDEGVLCYIVPPKFSKNSSGKKIRNIITSNKYLSKFIDFDSLQLFEEKSIYSSILKLNKKGQDTFFYERADKYGDLNSWWLKEDSDSEYSFEFNSNIIDEKPWVLIIGSKKSNLYDKIYMDSHKLEDIFTVSTGIQTSRDNIYMFHDNEIIQEIDNDDFKGFEIEKDGKSFYIEKSILKPLYKVVTKEEKGKNSYDIAKSTSHLIFPYDDNGDLYSESQMEENFSYCWDYLNYNKEELEKKDTRGGEQKWYQFGRTQNLNQFQNTDKLVAGVMTKYPFYYYDVNDWFVSTGGTAGNAAIIANEDSPYELEYIQAILSHPVITWILNIFGSAFEGKYKSKGKNILERVPIKKIDFNNELDKCKYDEIVTMTREVYEINEKLDDNSITKTEKAALNGQKTFKISEIQKNVSYLYGITDEEMSLIKEMDIEYIEV